MSTLSTLFLGISRDTWAEAQGRVELCPEISSAVIRPGANSPVRGVWGGVDVNKVVCPNAIRLTSIMFIGIIRGALPF